jgi:hypothetical protein
VLSVGREWIPSVCCQSVGSGYSLWVVSMRHISRSIRTILSGFFGLLEDGAPEAPKHVGVRLIF